MLTLLWEPHIFIPLQVLFPFMQPLFTRWTSGRCWMDPCVAVVVCFSPTPAACFFLEWVKEFSRRKTEHGQCLLLALWPQCCRSSAILCGCVCVFQRNSPARAGGVRVPFRRLTAGVDRLLAVVLLHGKPNVCYAVVLCTLWDLIWWNYAVQCSPISEGAGLFEGSQASPVCPSGKSNM